MERSQERQTLPERPGPVNQSRWNSHFYAVPRNRLILSLGANKAGPFGSARTTLSRAADELRTIMDGSAVSSIYETVAVGARSRRHFLNMIMVGRPRLSPLGTMRIIRRLEWRAGRRPAPRWSDRPLDIDLIDYCGKRLNWPLKHPPTIRGRGAHLVLPHPSAHDRAFVLRPLAELLPDWRHPITGQHILSLLRDNKYEARSVTIAHDVRAPSSTGR